MILGHKKILRVLEKMARDKEHVAHAFLFSGPEGVGKKTVALRFARALLCRKKSSVLGGCGLCDACVAANNGTNPDFLHVDPDAAAEKKKEKEKKTKKSLIAISDIRDLKKSLNMTPYYGGSLKVAVINDAHRMETEGFNAILKTLEEPPAGSVIILVSAFPEAMPQTILSRVQHVKFSHVSVVEIKEFLQESGQRHLMPYARDLARRPGLLFGGAIEGVREEERKRKTIRAILTAPLEERYRHVETLIAKEEDIDAAVDGWLAALREMISEAIAERDDGGGRSQDRIAALLHATKYLLELNFALQRTNVNKKLALDTFMLKLEEIQE